MIEIEKVLNKIREDLAPVGKSGYYATIHIDCWNYIVPIGRKRNSPDNIELHLSGEIFTDEMIAYDQQLFNLREKCKNEARIFFYGYSDLKITLNIFLNFMTEAGVALEKCYDPPCKGRFKPYNTCKLLNEAEYGMEFSSAIDCFVFRWNDEKNGKMFNIEFCVDSNLTTNVYFSASPFKIQGTRIKFLKCSDKSTPEISPNELSAVMKKFPDLLLELPDPKRIDTYNVGQGNFSTISCVDGKEMTFDLGFTKSENHLNYPIAKNKQENLDSDVVFISHLDIDHFLGVAYIPQTMFQKKWIVSVHEILTASAKRLVAYLYYNNLSNTWFVSDCGQSIAIGNYLFGQGSGRKIGNCTKINTGSLLLKLSFNGKTALLPGDCVYTGIHKAFHGEYDFLLVPHHCCDLEKQNDIDKFPATYHERSMAILSYGIGNSFGHPNNDHKRRLKQQNKYKISETPGNNIISFHF